MREPTILGLIAERYQRTMSAGKAASQSLDFAILEVAMLVAGLDARLLPCETKAFWRLAQLCPDYSPMRAQAAYERGLRGAGYLMALGQPGVATISQRVEAFVSEALKTLQESDLAASFADSAKAVAIWTAMACVDKDFSRIEQLAITVLAERFATLYVRSGVDGKTVPPAPPLAASHSN